MKLGMGVVGIALALACGGGIAAAQAPAEKLAAKTPDTAPTTYRLTYTVTELDGTRRVGTQRLSVTTNEYGGDARVKLGSRVPIVTGSSGASALLKETQVQYQDVGLSIEARVREFGNGVEIFSKVEQTGLAEEQSTVGRSDPVIRQALLQNTAVVTQGKPVMLGSLDIPGSTRHMDIEVVLEIVR